MLAQWRVALSNQIHLTSLPPCLREKGAQEPFESIYVFLVTSTLLDRGWSMKLGSTVFFLLFAIAQREQTISKSNNCVSTRRRVCLLFGPVYRRAVSLISRCTAHIRHLAITGSCSCQTPAGRFPNGGESYATNEDRGLFDAIFEYAHRCIGRGSSHHCGAVDYCHLFERRQVRQLHYEQVNQ